MSHDPRIAVAVIHGMGSQGGDEQDVDHVSFSAGLYSALKGCLDPAEWDGRVVYREIFWADILQNRQEAYLAEITADGARWEWLRDFVMHRLTDAAAYQRTIYSDIDPTDPAVPDDYRMAAAEDIYRRIHARVARTLARLQQIAGDGAPLVVFAHSLGGHIMSNYVYDMQKTQEVVDATGDFQRLKTMAGFLTFGCNIPVFSFAYPPGRIQPIAYPGEAIAPGLRLSPWWRNLNDRNDVLGMPLGPLGDAYAQMIADGQLEDRWISVGNVATSWNPASHNAYWTDRDFYKHAAQMIRDALAIADASGPGT